MNPLVATASIAMIIFSVVGVGVMTGLIPSSRSANDVRGAAESKVVAAAEEKTVAAPAAKAAPAVKAAATAAPAHKTATTAAHKPAQPAEAAQKPVQVAANERTESVPVTPPVARICTECGVIDAVSVSDKKGDGTGLGAVGGAVVGGLLGNQIGRGNGNTAATVVGAVGGALAGNEVEKRVKTTKEYHISVRMDDGSTRSFTFASDPAYMVGDKIKVIDGKLVRS
jgi:outer membrane lipoprotein SlyB